MSVAPEVSPASLLDLLLEQQFDFFTGVPDSTLTPLMHAIESRSEVRYVPAVSENVAVGLAAGAYLGGARPAVLMQNTGLALAAHPLTTLTSICRIPLLLVIGWRGNDGKDSPEHDAIGPATMPLLEALRVPFFVPDADTLPNELADAVATMDTQRCVAAVLIRPKVLS